MTSVRTTETYDDAAERLHDEMRAYERNLRAWLIKYDSLRWPRSTLVEARLQVVNCGRAPAHDLRLRLRIPRGLLNVRDDDPVAVDRPPDTPVFERRQLLAYPRLETEPAFEPPGPVFEALGQIEGPVFISDRRDLVAEFRASTLPPGPPDLSAGVLRLVAKTPGVYRVAWEAHSGNLRKPATGELLVEARPQSRNDAVLTTLDEVLQSGDVPIRWNRQLAWDPDNS